jgi:hypothetical protein
MPKNPQKIVLPTRPGALGREEHGSSAEATIRGKNPVLSQETSMTTRYFHHHARQGRDALPGPNEQKRPIREWFEIHLSGGTSATEARQRLARIARCEGHRVHEAETRERPFFLAVGILAESPARELERLMRLAAVQGACQEVEEW